MLTETLTHEQIIAVNNEILNIRDSAQAKRRRLADEVVRLSDQESIAILQAVIRDECRADAMYHALKMLGLEHIA